MPCAYSSKANCGDDPGKDINVSREENHVSWKKYSRSPENITTRGGVSRALKGGRGSLCVEGTWEASKVVPVM